VLRGSKGRFQLFGDTVNVASRMETTSSAGQIHVSKSTADELIASGMESWIVPRETRIMIKGKGELQTYLVQTKNASDDIVVTVSDDAYSI
jgi:class 3 adenylate cyclase